MSVAEHKAKGKKSIRCFVITISDTRSEANDTSGQTIKSMLGAEEHQIVGYRIVKDEPAQIEALLNEALAAVEVDAVIVNGGTGIAPRDGTYEVVSRLLEKKLEGFVEIFRKLS
jgi:molybdenum cofactor biosynthesis protein B